MRHILRPAIPALARLVPHPLAERMLGRWVPIFMLHRLEHPDYGVAGQSVSQVRACLEYLRKRRFRPIALAELARLRASGEPLPSRAVVFTVDDGFIDNAEVAAPLFSEYDIPLTVFVITDMLDGKLWSWDYQMTVAMQRAAAGRYRARFGDEALSFDLPEGIAARNAVIVQTRDWFKARDNSDVYAHAQQLCELLGVPYTDTPPREYAAMSWQQANALVAAGHSVAAHSKTHRMLSKLNDGAVAEEISGSISRLRECVAGAANLFAYPTGRAMDFGAREVALLRKAGIEAAVTTIADAVVPRNSLTADDLLQLPRYSLPGNLIDFVQYLDWIEVAKQRWRTRGVG